LFAGGWLRILSSTLVANVFLVANFIAGLLKICPLAYLELVMVRVFTIAILLLHCGPQVSSLQAQLRGYGPSPAAREPARVGLLGAIREAREDRFQREAQVAAAAARAAATGPAARNPNLNPLANPYANRNLASPNLNTARNSAVANNNMLRRDPVTGAVPPTSLSAGANQRSIEAARAANLGRTANYRGTNPQNANANSSAFNNAGNNNAGRQSTYVLPASASEFVPAPMRDDRNYEGPGVAIRLPEDARGIVNYLVDDVENNTVRPGQQQVLDAKGSFVIRYSRGVTSDGRSFGESRYTVTEGRYRFELTDTGWELYRETQGEGELVPQNRIDMAESNLQFSAPRELPTESLATERPEPNAAESAVTSEAAEAVNAEELPAPKPRSILEK